MRLSIFGDVQNMKVTTWVVILSMAMLSDQATAQNFKAQQAKFARVQTAITEKEAVVKKLFADRNLSYPPKEIFLRAFKREQVIELWVKNADAYHLLKEYV